MVEVVPEIVLRRLFHGENLSFERTGSHPILRSLKAKLDRTRPPDDVSGPSVRSLGWRVEQETWSFWPSPLQEQLLEVALGDGDRAVDTWECLRPGFDLTGWSADRSHSSRSRIVPSSTAAATSRCFPG